MSTWALFGATGVLGELIAQEALSRGHRPLLVGRDAPRLRAVASRLRLSMQVAQTAEQRLEVFRASSLVLNAAGPFTQTGLAVLDSALEAKRPCLDVSGELPFLREVLAAHPRALAAEVPVLTGVGFGVAAADLLATAVLQRVVAPQWLRVSVDASVGFTSPAVAQSTQAVLRFGGHRIGDGALVSRPLADRRWSESGPEGARRSFASAPLAELLALKTSTGVREIDAGIPMPAPAALVVRAAWPLLSRALRFTGAQRAAARRTGHAGTADAAHLSRVWVRAGDAAGREEAGLLETGEGFAFAARAAVAAVARVLEGALGPGVHTPAALGLGFLDAIGGAQLRVLPSR